MVKRRPKREVRYRKRRQGKRPHWKAAIVPLGFVLAALAVLGSGGLTFGSPLSVTPSLRTTTPSPTPFTSVAPQTADTTSSTTRAAGVAPLTPQAFNTSGTTTLPSGGGPSIAAQVRNGAATTTQPSGAQSDSFHSRGSSASTNLLGDFGASGTANIASQVATPEGTASDPDLPSGVHSAGTFSVDVDADGNLDTVNFVITDAGDGIVFLDVSADDTDYGEGTLTDGDAEDNDDARISGSGGSGTGQLRLGDSTKGYTFNVSFGLTSASLTSTTFFFRQVTDSTKMDLDGDGAADDELYVVLSDTNSNGLYDTADVSIGDKVFGEGILTNASVDFGATDNTDDESVGVLAGESSTQTANVKFGTYTFEFRFDNNPSNDVSDLRFKNVTWFTGEFQADLNADADTSDDADIIAFALADTDGDGLYDSLDLSIDDGPLATTTFGETQDNTLTSSGNDLQIGSNYTFTVAFDNNPGTNGDTEDVSLIAKTRFTGSFDFDVDASGAIATDSSETINVSLFDTDSNGLYDTLEAALGSGAPSGNLSDSEISSGNGERLSSGSVPRIGTTFFATIAFDANPPADGSDVAVTLASNSGSPLAYNGSAGFLIDADGDKSADDRVFFVLSDTNSDGTVDTLDISTGAVFTGVTFGEGASTDSNENGVNDGLEDSVVDFGILNGTNDERVALASAPKTIRIGVHYFQVQFDAAVAADTSDARLAARWYAGTFSVDLDDNGSNETLDFVQIDQDSDGLYSHFELDANDDGSYGASEVHTSNGATVSLGNGTVTLAFSTNPTESESAVLTKVTSSTSSQTVVGADQSVTEERTIGASIDVAAARRALAQAEAAASAASEATRQRLAEAQRNLSAAEHQAEVIQRAKDVAQGMVPRSAEAPAASRIVTDASGQRLAGDEVVVGLRSDIPNPNGVIAEIARLVGGRVVGSVPLLGTYQIQIPASFLGSLEAKILSLEGNPDVAFLSRHLLSDLSRFPVTPEFDDWNQDRPDGTNWNLEAIRAPSSWDLTVGARNVKVGIIDAEFDNVHQDLRDNVIAHHGPLTHGIGGHGTHVAGTACANGHNRVGISGVSWDCAMTLHDFGGASSVVALQAMVRTVNEGARVVNISAQWIENNQCGRAATEETLQKVKENNDILRRAIAYGRIRNSKTLWVFAAGNECRDVRFASPASLVEMFPDDVIVVGAIDRNGRRSAFSNHGPLVSVWAPGSEILSTLPRNCQGTQCSETYGFKSGTSMAAPHVTGLAAMLTAERPDLTPREVKGCIVSTTRPTGAGLPLIDAEGALRCAMANAPASTAPFGGG